MGDSRSKLSAALWENHRRRVWPPIRARLSQKISDTPFELVDRVSGELIEGSYSQRIQAALKRQAPAELLQTDDRLLVVALLNAWNEKHGDGYGYLFLTESHGDVGPIRCKLRPVLAGLIDIAEHVDRGQAGLVTEAGNAGLLLDIYEGDRMGRYAIALWKD